MAQFLYNSDVWKAKGGFVSGTAAQLPSVSIQECFRAVIRLPYGLYGCLICVAAMGILLLLLRASRYDSGGADKDRNFDYSDRGTYGTAGYMTDAEMQEVFEYTDVKHCRGTILGEVNGKVVAVPEDSLLNRNIAVFGSAGTMKSRAFARVMALQCIRRGESLLVLDTKAALYADLAVYAQKCGYTCRVFNLISPTHSDSWACLREVDGDETMAQVFADVIIKNTSGGKSDHFWDSGELNLLKALILYVDLGYPDEAKTLGEVYKLLTLNDETALTKLFSVLPPTHPARAPFAIFKKASDSVRSGIIVGLGARLQLMQSPLICNITSSPEIDLTLPGREKCIYFVVTSDQDSTFDFMVSLFFSFLFIKLVRLADQGNNDGKLPIPVHIIGDEWPNAAGAVPDFYKKISTIRSRNLSISVIFQSLAQMQNRYPDNQWLEILGNCDVQLFLGCSDPETAEFISRRAGEISVQVSSRSKMFNTWRTTDYVPQYRETSSIGRRRLLTPDEVLRFPMDEALVILRTQKVLKVKKFDYLKHTDAKRLIKSSAYDHIPKWYSQLSPVQVVQVPAQDTIVIPDEEQPPLLIKSHTSHTAGQRKRRKTTTTPDPGQMHIEEAVVQEIDTSEIAEELSPSPQSLESVEPASDSGITTVSRDDIMT